ncbi:hypothetical protein TanjilG_10700 [Lupinus angustifolius]|nr:hypothetical protein TanjilG_10700 [Lupinus angustifolius]
MELRWCEGHPEDNIDVDNCVELVVIEDMFEVVDLTSNSDHEVVGLVGAGVGAVPMANKDDTEGDPIEGSSAPSIEMAIC